MASESQSLPLSFSPPHKGVCESPWWVYGQTRHSDTGNLARDTDAADRVILTRLPEPSLNLPVVVPSVLTFLELTAVLCFLFVRVSHEGTARSSKRNESWASWIPVAGSTSGPQRSLSKHRREGTHTVRPEREADFCVARGLGPGTPRPI